MDATQFPPGYLEEYNGNSLIISLSIFIAIIVIAVALRFWAKTLTKSRFGIDDWLMIPSAIFGILTISTCLAMVNFGGVGHHIAAVAIQDPNKLIVFAKLVIVSDTFYFVSMNLPKISMLFTFLHIFVVPWQRKACYALIGLLVAITFGDLIANWNLCSPLAFFWDKTIPGGHCVDLDAFGRWLSFPNIVTDVIMLLLPIPSILQLQLKWKDKVGLLLTFILGGGGLTASILRFHTFLTSSTQNGDLTWYFVEAGIYAMLEITVYNVCACLPFYRAFYIYVRRGAGRTTNSTNISRTKQSTRMSTHYDDYQIPLREGTKNQIHTRADDVSEEYANPAGINVRSEYHVTSDKASSR